MRILLTGANGFVGSHVAEALVEQKHEVTAIVRKTSNLAWLSSLPLIYKYGDLSDKRFLEICSKDADVVIHCAGVVRAMDKDGYFKSNVDYTKNFCEAVLASNPNLKKFIFISSQAAMGPSLSNKPKLLTERETPVSDYGLSKLAAEGVVKSVLGGKVPYTIIRPASVYGPRDKDIFIFFNLIHKHLRPATVERRLVQLVYVKDIAQGVVNSIENAQSDNKLYYLGNETPYTWTEMGKVIAESVGKKAMPIPVPDFVFKFAGVAAQSFSYLTKKPAVLNRQKITEMLQEYWLADNSAAKTDLKIEFTPLEIASKITYNWYLRNHYF
ncbi:NAD-dependent epimerase/dehydratase family protein [Endomicrobium proavitum]|uniref:Nucleoside-diphosphate-sugar epimerase n=1 Tax=Endomicrobium proavitum TaxID=1408281 RepID=A0A0G3WJL6_9BACT|nr:NAD(P)-dependent oxidoreductase [Endomicrobium proavitum]AKL97689.1 Nucleoside-diphosphate-sugar epimerase [Endomicrobium proavitum]